MTKCFRIRVIVAQIVRGHGECAVGLIKRDIPDDRVEAYPISDAGFFSPALDVVK